MRKRHRLRLWLRRAHQGAQQKAKYSQPVHGWHRFLPSNPTIGEHTQELLQNLPRNFGPFPILSYCLLASKKTARNSTWDCSHRKGMPIITVDLLDKCPAETTSWLAVEPACSRRWPR